ncbi:MAG TPA: Ig-like domain-containing protein [Candidatus Limnocylindria bacterium]
MRGVPLALVVALVLAGNGGAVARAAQIGSPANAAMTTPCGAAGVPTSTVYLPNITKTLGGPLGWDTPFYVQNAGAIQTTVEATFYRFSDGAPVACQKTAALAPGTSMVDDPDRDTYLTDDTQYSVVLRSFGAPIVATVTQLQGAGTTTEALSYAGSSVGGTTVYLPNVTRRFYGYDVPFIIQNLGTTTTLVTARFIDFAGTQTLTIRRVIDPGRSRVIDPNSDDAVLGAPGLVDGTQYAVTLTADQPIAVVANAENRAVGPVAYSMNGIIDGATAVYAPYAMKLLNALFSPVVVQNLSASVADARLTFTPLAGGGVAQVFTLASIPAGGSRAFDPRFALGTTTPCLAAVPAVCLANGEYSLKIESTVPIAGVVLPNSATTAAGYPAATTFQPRATLPVVTRTVGGPAGWTTSMFIERGTATSATLRYYALGTRTLAATQQIALGTSSIRIDPRGVVGLADGTTYSVTIDGNGGTLAAIAYQQALTGGDASMMYEAFGAPSLPVAPQVGSLRVSFASDTIIAGASEQLTASVYDQFGEPLASSGTTWSASPGTLGAVSPSGILTTTGSGGTVNVVATSGTVSTTIAITVVVPRSTSIGGLSFRLVSTTAVDVYSDAAISLADDQRILVQTISDMAQVQGDYTTAYTNRPSVYVLSTPSAFSAAIQAIGAVSAPSPWASGECVCSGDHSWIFVDWQDEAALGQLRDLRHELTHAIERDLAPDAFYPAWFDEGNARAEELTIPSTEWFADEERYRAASMAAKGALFTLADLSSPYTWAARSQADATYAYAVATEAVLLLRSDIGMAGELATFQQMAQGASFEDAYAAIAGRPFSDFAQSFASRIRVLAPPSPGIVTASSTPVGPGTTFVIYGLPSNAMFSLSIVGNNGYQLTGGSLRLADTYGFFTSYIAGGWPPGTYTISATWSGGTVSTVAVKTASFDGSAAMAGEPSSGQ